MLSYHNDPKLKSKIVRSAHAHAKAGRYVQSLGHWEKGKGRAVGCTLASVGVPAKERGNYQHYEDKLGIPRTIACLEDQIFEESSSDYSKTWPVRFAEAVPVGKDLSMVGPRLMHWMLGELPGWAELDAARDADVIALIFQVRALYERWIEGDKPSEAEWLAADASYAATDYYSRTAAASAAAFAAARASYAYAASYAASAASYAYAYAYAAASAYAAYMKVMEQIGDKLLELIQAA